jgi:hypothetical protein
MRIPTLSKVLLILGMLGVCEDRFSAVQAAPRLRVSTDFEGASARILRIDAENGVVEFTPGGDPERGWPCWWFFRVDGLVADQTLTLRLRRSEATVSEPSRFLSKPLASAWAMPSQAAVSNDGQKWKQTDRGSREGDWMVYNVRAEGSAVWVAWGPPYTGQTAAALVHDLSHRHPGVEARELCRSREGRPVPMLRVSEGAKPAGERFGVWVQARQHAWEAGSSWVADGFGRWLLGDSAEALWVRQNAEVFLVPVMDVDNVATGNGGKDAIPHDHNRDWSDAPHWNASIAAQQQIRQLVAASRMDVFLDLHNPTPLDPTFFYALAPEWLPETSRPWNERFRELTYEHMNKGTRVTVMSNRPKLMGPEYHPLWKNISANWVAVNANPRTVSLCLETAWNSPASHVEGYRAVGGRLGEALREFLGELPPRP